MIRRALSLAVLLWVLGFALFAFTLPRPAGDAMTDAIVVPTGGQGRIGRGIELLERHRAQRMLITGVDRQVPPRELARVQQISPALLACCIDLGREAIDTRSNGEETATWIARHRYGSVRLVTTDWHMPRAKFELEHALGENVAIVPDAVVSEAGLRVLVREYNKYLLRRAAVLVGL